MAVIVVLLLILGIGAILTTCQEVAKSAGKSLVIFNEPKTNLEEDMQAHVTKWCYLNGEVKMKHEVSTTRNQNESDEEWFARHVASVNTAKATYVPVSCD